jgi:large subunit ribosomal protein L13
MKTFSIKASEINRKWLVVDANGKTLGRLASAIAHRLRGKHKPEYTPHMDVGDHVIVINADKITVTGKKAEDKIYNWHSGYTGGIKEINFAKLLVKNPEMIFMRAIKGMLPKGPLGRQMLTKLKVYVGTEHPHEAQQPELTEL